jgi:DNA (cytosine-5)-methyltransferase 1
MRAVDLFCGAGGLSLGLKQAGIDSVLANEIEKDFANTHKSNFPNCRMLNKPIGEVDFRAELASSGLEGKIDLLVGGPPCQGFSTVGKKKASDPRNSLFLQFLRAVEETAPRFVVFENVAGFKRLYGGEMYNRTVEGLDRLGFDLVSSVLNAKDFGTPQSRERTIILAWSRGEKAIQMPESTHGTGSTPCLTLLEAISDLPPLRPGEEKKAYLCDPQNEYQRYMRASGCPLTEHKCAKYGDHIQEVMSHVPAGGSIMDVPEELRPKGYFKNTYARLLPDVPCMTITRNFGTPSSSRCIHPHQNRALSTREGARIQGFPDHYIFHGGKGSKNLQIGNAVPPALAFALGRQVVLSGS